LRLDKNERIVPFPDEVMARFYELLTPDAVMTYPELEPLYRKLADYLGVERDHLYLAAGSDLGIKTVYETFIDPGNRVLIHQPSYAMQQVYSKMFQAHVTEVSFDKRLTLDVEAFIDAITPETRLVVLENPNGFIGNVLPQASIRAIVEKAHRCNAIMLLDEAYYLFSGQTVQPLYLEFDNVIITRTFSKDLGAAGLRCGYLISQKHNIQFLNRVKPMYEVNNACVAFVQASLDFPQYISAFVKDVHEGLQFLRNQLENMGLTTAGGSGNFLVVYLGEDIDITSVIRHLKSRGILVRRPFQVTSLKGWLRIVAGNLEQMRRFVLAFAEGLDAAGWRADRYVLPGRA
jgi:histidinol-phosphate aminotransferase